MDYKPGRFDDSVNLPKGRIPLLTECLWICGALIGIVLIAYIIIGLLVDTAASMLSPESEAKLWSYMDSGQIISSLYETELTFPQQRVERRLQALIDSIPSRSMPFDYPITVHYVPDDTVNALALPGGHILVYDGLLKQLSSENGLMFVLAHELGHFAHRDHLRQMGRSLVLALILGTTIGQGDAAQWLISSSAQGMDLHYSREQEQASDVFALTLLNDIYGHVGGATELFEYLKTVPDAHPPAYLSTHPLPQTRIDAINALIQSGTYRVRSTKELTIQ